MFISSIIIHVSVVCSSGDSIKLVASIINKSQALMVFSNASKLPFYLLMYD